MNQQRNRRRGPGQGLSPVLIYLGFELWRQFNKLENKPPVTLALLALNIVPFIYPVNIFGYGMSNISQNCLNPAIIVSSLLNPHNPSILINRIILPGFIHADDMHLYYNMISLSWKGINLEKELGSGQFLRLVIFSLLVSHVSMICLSYSLNTIGFGHSISGYQTCAVGFSAVLFSLKYVWNYLSPKNNVIMGISIPSKYSAWAELVFASIISPNVSFLGHLCGILAGMLYIHCFRYILDGHPEVPSDDSSYSSNRSRYTYASGSTGYGDNSNQYSYESAEDIRRRRTERYS